MSTTSITYTEYRERVSDAILTVLAELPDTTYNDDPFKNRMSHGDLLDRIDFRYHLEVRDVLDHLVSGGQVMRTTTDEGDLFSLTPWHRWADVVELAREHGGWLTPADFTETLDTLPQDGLLAALVPLVSWGVLEGKRIRGDFLFRYLDPVEQEYEDVTAQTPAEERRDIRRFLFDAHRRAVAEYNEVGGMNDTWDLVERLEAEGHDMAAVGRLLLAEFLDGQMDDRHAVRFSVSTTPLTR